DRFVEHHGWTEAVRRLRGAFAHGDIDGVTAAVSDDMLDAIAVCGTYDQARNRLAQRRIEKSLPRDIAYLAPPSFLTSGRRRARYARNSLPLLHEPGFRE